MVRSAITIGHLNVGFLPDPVQVLVQAVQEEGEQLLAVLLLVARELGGKPSDGHLEGSGDDVGELATPHVLDELAKGSGNLSLHSKWVVLIDVLHIVVVVKVFSHFMDVGQALQWE